MKVILPGSYDPVTKGHLEIIRYAAERYKAVYVVAFINESKTYRFTLEEKLEMLKIATRGMDNVIVDVYPGRVVDYMRLNGIDKIVKGYRNKQDLEWENVQADYNMSEGGFATELVKCNAEFQNVSSTLVRSMLDAGKDASELLPEGVLDFIRMINNQEG